MITDQEKFMRAIVVRKPADYGIEEVPIKRLRHGEALVRVTYNTLCGSDLRVLDGTMQHVNYPIIPGHEWCGTIVETNPGNAQLLGKRVVGEIVYPCYACDVCNRGRSELCPNLREQGFEIDGGLAEYLVAETSKISVVPSEIEPQFACLVEPFSIALHAVERVHVSIDDRVVIFGAGAIGLLILQSAKLRGVSEVAVVDRLEYRLELSRHLGATSAVFLREDAHETLLEEIGDFDVGILACDQVDGFDLAIRAVKRGGKIVVVGNTADQLTGFKPNVVMQEGLEIYGITSPPNGFMNRCLGILRKGVIQLKPLVTHVFPLDNFEEAYSTFRRRQKGVIRAAIRPPSSDLT